MSETERLFSYGTLQTESVQLSTFGRTFSGSPDALVGYRLRMIKIEDQDFVVTSGAEYHRTLEFTGSASDFVEGTVFSVTQPELEQADAYEPDGYERIQVKLRSGTEAWMYLNTNQTIN
ncbi:MAG TPA: gamma-glutamylcyclotransferase family protein [Pyrinomonadaceae bacterium]|nr:gamma-glutamylcyclotransferase family protein [Pyrinomonadaceae bacterium]